MPTTSPGSCAPRACASTWSTPPISSASGSATPSWRRSPTCSSSATTTWPTAPSGSTPAVARWSVASASATSSAGCVPRSTTTSSERAPELGLQIAGIGVDAACPEPGADVGAVAAQVVEAQRVAGQVDHLGDVDEHQSSVVHEHVVGRQVAVGVAQLGEVGEHGAQLAVQVGGLVG